MDETIDHHSVAQYLHVTTRTLRTWIKDGRILRPIAIGRKRFWVKPVLEAWLRERGRVSHDQRAIESSKRTRARRGRPRLPA